MAGFIVVVAFVGIFDSQRKAFAGELPASGMDACSTRRDVAAHPGVVHHEAADSQIKLPLDRHSSGGAAVGCPEKNSAHDDTSQESFLSLEQALADDASGHPAEARKRYDVLVGTPLEASAAIPSAINLVSLGRFDEAKRAFAALSDSADLYTAGYAQLWQLWITMRTYQGDARGLREQMARATVGLRAADDFQQSVLNLYAGQGSVEAVFTTAESDTIARSPQRPDARTEAALFAGGYLQYVVGEAEKAQRLYRRELSQSSGSYERPVLQRLIADP
jgi:hypothetical protein